LKAFELQLDVCAHWLEIAVDNLRAAEDARGRSSLDGGDAAQHDAMETEFKHAMQAVVGAATFFEALYSAVLERDPQNRPKSPKGAIRRRSPRHYQVAEVLRRSFGLRSVGTSHLRSVLKEIYRFRNEAVHPGAQWSPPVRHQFYGTGVARHVAMFSFENVKELVRAALAFSLILPSRDLSRRSVAIQEYAAFLTTVLQPLYTSWRSRYGKLLDSDPPA
jgi:hypothetical protein